MSTEKRLLQDVRSSMVFLTEGSPNDADVLHVAKETEMTIDKLEALLDKHLEETRKLKEEVIRLNVEANK